MPRGAEPYGDVLRSTEYTAGARICPGEIVILSSDGFVDPITSVGPCLGVALSFASAAAAKVKVADHPDQLFIIQEDSSTAALAAADVGRNYNVLATADNTVFNTARMELDSSAVESITIAVDASIAPLKFLGVPLRPDNAIGANADCLVKINNHILGGGSGTLGI